MRRSLLLLGLGIVTGLAFAGVWLFASPYQLRGSQLEPPVSAPDFTLQSTAGGDYTLSQQSPGKVTLLFFGYTTCPDVCPATLGEMKELVTRLDDRASGVQVVFVTVDPQRDTLDKLRDYLGLFDPRFVGLSGSQAVLEKVWQSYGVYRADREVQSSTGYLVDHTARLYAVDRQGRLRLTWAFGTPVDDILADVRFLLKEK